MHKRMSAKCQKRTYNQKERPPFGRPIKRLSAKSVHTELAHRHHKVMRLVVSALNHDAHKAERL